MSGTLTERLVPSDLDIIVSTDDIAELPAQAILTAINRTGFWDGYVDIRILWVAAGQYHEQARLEMRKYPNCLPPDGHAVLAGRVKEHGGEFKSVVFVFDDAAQPMRDVVFAGLQKAEEEGIESIAVPCLRTGRLLKFPDAGLSPEAMADEMLAGIAAFVASKPKDRCLKTIVFSAFQDVGHKQALDQVFSRE